MFQTNKKNYEKKINKTKPNKNKNSYFEKEKSRDAIFFLLS